MLDERDFLENAYTKQQNDFRNTEDEFRKLKAELLDCVSVVCSINYRQYDAMDLISSLSQLKHDFK